MKEELMRRISAALDSPDGLAGDPALQEELRADPQNAKYAKDLTRIGKWLAVWPLPEPDDAAFETLASRIEQRLDEALGAISDPTAAPSFEDDDAIRDATASLLQSGEYRVSDSAIELLSSDSAIPLPAAAAAPPSEPKSPIAKVALGKVRVPAIVEEHSGTGEPLSAAELQQRLGAKGDADKPKKKKIGLAAPGTPAEKKKRKKQDGDAPGATARTKSSDRISIPTPKTNLAPTLSPVVQLPKQEEKKPAGTLWWFAAAAAVGLGVFGAATIFESQGAPTAESARGSTLVTSGAVMPTVAAAPVAPAPTEAMPPPPTELAAAQVEAPPVVREEPPRYDAHARPPASTAAYAPMRIAEPPAHASGGGRAGLGDLAGPSDDDDGAVARRRSAGSGTSAAGPTTPSATPTPSPAPRTTTTTAEAPPPPPATETATTRTAPAPTAPATGTAALPETPDRETIQAVLEARSAAVAACANGAHGLADIDIVIASTGRITTATVNGAFAGTPVGSCMARAVRGATFPPFSQPRFEVTYPYHL